MLGFSPIASAAIADESTGVPGAAVPIVVGTNDVILRAVPSDANPNDVRLYGLTTSDPAWTAIQTSAEASSAATMAERVSAAITTSAEQSSAATLAERYVIAIASVAEQSSAATLAERISAAIATSAEQHSAATLVERISLAITTANEAFSDATGVEREADTIATSAEQYSAAALTVTNPPAVSIAIATSAEQSSAATILVPTPEPEGADQGRGGGRYIDPFQSTPQKLTVSVVSSTEVSSDAVMGVTIPATPIPRVTMRVASRIGAPSSQGTVRERLGIIAASSIAVGSDSRFEATIHLSAVEYERMMQSNDDDEVMMLHEMAMA